ncbi:TetR/AcrR family transcriptional regulator [Amycolatopsis albispora]|uniref:TetR family transcriptional regulator n=1 Tax=Amycolatopsis albispora TaxID=1804986 RepID=A0A344L2H8_9PSEU|nr:TetR/AcrR family transcriptional regulator [Amycolatopsis albispora]AXB42252.1 TetR family transcriptional regulator [Amycolatopsis albispora]
MAERSRRRGEHLEQAIFEAVWAELLEVGYAKLTMEAVAARAGTSKPVLYRRWAGRAELVLAAWRHRLPVSLELPDTGTLSGDLKELLGRSLCRFEDFSPDLLAGLTTETFRDPEVFALLRKQIAKAAPGHALAALIGWAVERGEIAEPRLSPRVLALPLDLIRADAVLYGRQVTDARITEIVDDIFLPLLRGLAAP